MTRREDEIRVLVDHYSASDVKPFNIHCYSCKIDLNQMECVHVLDDDREDLVLRGAPTLRIHSALGLGPTVPQTGIRILFDHLVGAAGIASGTDSLGGFGID